MTRRQQEQFVRDLISHVRLRIVEKLARVPADWEGIELRHFIADAFNNERISFTGNSNVKYENAILENDL